MYSPGEGRGGEGRGGWAVIRSVVSAGEKRGGARVRFASPADCPPNVSVMGFNDNLPGFLG